MSAPLVEPSKSRAMAQLGRMHRSQSTSSKTVASTFRVGDSGKHPARSQTEFDVMSMCSVAMQSAHLLDLCLSASASDGVG